MPPSIAAWLGEEPPPYGVVLPGLVIALLFLLPYLDRNPSRRPQDRKLMISAGILFIVLWAVLTWMGTPAYKAKASPPEEVALEFVPTDREGRIHEIPWDGLEEGVYDTDTFTEGATNNPEHLEAFMVGLREAMEVELPDGVAVLTVQIWQRELKRVDLDITWPEGGEEHTFKQHTYIHRSSAP